MTTLVVATGYNRPGINKRTGRPWADADGAFLPEAEAFQELHGGRIEVEGLRRDSGARRKWAEHTIRSCPGLDTLAVFGHGTPTTLVATGHGIETKRQASTLWSLTFAIDDVAKVRAEIILYACLTARGKLGFADQLADLLPCSRVWSHSTAGHTTWNPFVELAGGPNGGDPVFTQKDGPRWRRWRERLKEQAFRLSFWKAARGLPRADALEAVREEATR